jgi:hypothetical protein
MLWRLKFVRSRSNLDLQFLIELDREALKSGKKSLKVEQFGKVSL